MRQTRLFDHVARIGVQLLPVAERVPAGGRPIKGWSSWASPRGGATMPEQYNPNGPAGDSAGASAAHTDDTLEGSGQ
jgi:hypothetical protein